jgi:hypothetical protein
MRPAETIAKLSSFEHRGAGTDAERRTAAWLASAVKTSVRDSHVEPFWCRPNWALAHAWHVALGLAGSLVAESDARVGGALILVALLSLVTDEASGLSLGRRLTREHASQNVVSEAESDTQVHLIVTANYDSGRTGLTFRDPIRKAHAALANATGRIAPGWRGWIVIAFAWLIVIAVLRLEGHRGTLIGIVQLIPTVGLVLALALLLEQASARFGSGANDNSSGVAAAIAIVKALDPSPPRHLRVDLVLQGAGDGGGIGLRQYLRSRKSQRNAPNTVVLGIAPCDRGVPRWFRSDGALLPLAYFRELQKLCESVAREDPGLGAHSHRGRGFTPALPARERRLPAIAVGSTREGGDALDSVVEFGLLLVDAIDAYVGKRTAPPAATPA